MSSAHIRSYGMAFVSTQTGAISSDSCTSPRISVAQKTANYNNSSESQEKCTETIGRCHPCTCVHCHLPQTSMHHTCVPQMCAQISSRKCARALNVTCQMHAQCTQNHLPSTGTGSVCAPTMHLPWDWLVVKNKRQQALVVQVRCSDACLFLQLQKQYAAQQKRASVL